MKKTIDYIRGTVTVEVKGRFPERFMNICAENGVEFWELTRTEENILRVRMHTAGYNTLKALDVPFEISIIKKRGVPFFLRKFKKRIVLIVAIALCFSGILLMSRFIWKIEVSGNESVSTERILSALNETGVSIGSWASKVDAYTVRNSMLLQIDELLWMTINVKGSRAEVIVREREEMPVIPDIKKPADIVAKKAGLIIKLRVLSGRGVVEIGQTVTEGETLISGALTNTMEEDRYVHSMGEIYARTWYTLKATTPLSYGEKMYTGSEKVKRSLIVGNKRINLYFNSSISFANYDKIMEIGSGELFDIMALPFKMVKETYREYEKLVYTMTDEEAQQMLRESLLAELEAMAEGGEVLGTVFEFSVKDGAMTATLYAECMEEIGETVMLETMP